MQAAERLFHMDDEKETDEETAEVLQMKHELSETLSDFRKQILEKMKARKVKHSLSDQRPYHEKPKIEVRTQRSNSWEPDGTTDQGWSGGLTLKQIGREMVEPRRCVSRLTPPLIDDKDEFEKIKAIEKRQRRQERRKKLADGYFTPNDSTSSEESSFLPAYQTTQVLDSKLETGLSFYEGDALERDGNQSAVDTTKDEMYLSEASSQDEYFDCSESLANAQSDSGISVSPIYNLPKFDIGSLLMFPHTGMFPSAQMPVPGLYGDMLSHTRLQMPFTPFFPNMYPFGPLPSVDGKAKMVSTMTQTDDDTATGTRDVNKGEENNDAYGVTIFHKADISTLCKAHDSFEPPEDKDIKDAEQMVPAEVRTPSGKSQDCGTADEGKSRLSKVVPRSRGRGRPLHSTAVSCALSQTPSHSTGLSAITTSGTSGSPGTSVPGSAVHSWREISQYTVKTPLEISNYTVKTPTEISQCTVKSTPEISQSTASSSSIISVPPGFFINPTRSGPSQKQGALSCQDHDIVFFMSSETVAVEGNPAKSDDSQSIPHTQESHLQGCPNTQESHLQGCPNTQESHLQGCPNTQESIDASLDPGAFTESDNLPSIPDDLHTKSTSGTVRLKMTPKFSKMYKAKKSAIQSYLSGNAPSSTDTARKAAYTGSQDDSNRSQAKHDMPVKTPDVQETSSVSMTIITSNAKPYIADKPQDVRMQDAFMGKNRPRKQDEKVPKDHLNKGIKPSGDHSEKKRNSEARSSRDSTSSLLKLETNQKVEDGNVPTAKSNSTQSGSNKPKPRSTQACNIPFGTSVKVLKPEVTSEAVMRPLPQRPKKEREKPVRNTVNHSPRRIQGELDVVYRWTKASDDVMLSGEDWEAADKDIFVPCSLLRKSLRPIFEMKEAE